MGTAPDGKGKRDILCWPKLVNGCRPIRANPEPLSVCLTLCPSSMCLWISERRGAGHKDGDLLPRKAICVILSS